MSPRDVFHAFIRPHFSLTWHGVRYRDDEEATGCGMTLLATDERSETCDADSPLEGAPFCIRCADYEYKRTPKENPHE